MCDGDCTLVSCISNSLSRKAPTAAWINSGVVSRPFYVILGIRRDNKVHLKNHKAFDTGEQMCLVIIIFGSIQLNSCNPSE